MFNIEHDLGSLCSQAKNMVDILKISTGMSFIFSCEDFKVSRE